MGLPMLKSQRRLSDRACGPPDALLCQPFDAFRSAAQGSHIIVNTLSGGNETIEMTPIGRALEFLTTRYGKGGALHDRLIMKRRVKLSVRTSP